MRKVATPPPPVNRAVGSRRPAPSVSVRPRPRIGRCPDTGRGSLGRVAQHPRWHPGRTQLTVRDALVRLSGRDTESVVRALGEQVRRLPKAVMATLTWERVPQMAAHKSFTIATDVSVYFRAPKSPWQRGTSENTNGLLRRYLPKEVRPFGTRSSRPRADRAQAHHWAPQGFRLEHPGCHTGQDRCAHRLNPPLLFLRFLSPGAGF
jgi:hypothetical protein